jgi:hypothetical protein
MAESVVTFRHNITGDALASRDNVVAAAATVAGKTYVYLGYEYGQLLPWKNLTAAGPVVGATPRLAISPCGWFDAEPFRAVALTTLNAGKATVTTFPVSCDVGSMGTVTHNRPPISGPNISSLAPNFGTQGTGVLIHGSGFAASHTTVNFNGVPSSSVTVNSSTQLWVIAPAGSGVSAVQAVVSGVGSQLWSATYFDYYRPAITSVSPSAGPPGTLVYIGGLNFSGVTHVYFGATRATTYTVESSQLIEATSPAPPAFTSTVNVTVVASGGWSQSWNPDHYTYQLPAVVSTIVTGAVGADPLWLPGPGIGYECVVVANATSSQLLEYNSSNIGYSFSRSTIGEFSPGLGSNVFTAVGQTRLVNPGGPTGQVATVAEGSVVFSVVTTESQGIIMAETFGSQNGGENWTTPYLTEPPSGSMSDPQVAVSPAGYFYLTWRENGAGPWQVDQAVFSETGRMILPPQVIPYSGGASGYSAEPPTVAVDGLQRPLFAWGVPNSTGNELRLDGAYPSATNLVSTLFSAYNSTVPADFNQSITNVFGQKAYVDTDLATLALKVQPTVSNATQCAAFQILISEIYQNVTDNALPARLNPNSLACSIAHRSSDGYLSELAGPLVANTYLMVYADWISEAIAWGGVWDPSWLGSPDGGLNYSLATDQQRWPRSSFRLLRGPERFHGCTRCAQCYPDNGNAQLDAL